MELFGYPILGVVASVAAFAFASFVVWSAAVFVEGLILDMRYRKGDERREKSALEPWRWLIQGGAFVGLIVAVQVVNSGG